MVSLSFSESQSNPLLGLALGVAGSHSRMGLPGTRPTFLEPTGAVTCQPPRGVPAHAAAPCQRDVGSWALGGLAVRGLLNSLVVGVPLSTVSHQWGVSVSVIHLPELSPLQASTSQAALSS